MANGALTVVGTGIHLGHITAEAKGWITRADKVLYCIADAATERYITRLNSSSESMFPFYGEGKSRTDTYNEMVERTLFYVRKGQHVCAAYYGHPGIFVNPAHRSIRAAREEGYSATMLPAVSSIDCLFCDLGVDPSSGCQILEATDLMLRQRYLDTASHLIILQVSALGELDYHFNGYDQRHLPTLGEYLAAHYPRDFGIKIYHAAQFPLADATISETTVGALTKEVQAGVSTIYIPPMTKLPVHLRILEQYDLTHLLNGKRLVPLNATATELLKEHEK